MKRLSTIMICLFAMTMASLSAKAQEITIYLMPGWNWISYTNAVSMDIDEALGDFVPMEGDMLKSKYSSTKYSNGQWRGRLEQFTPGLGYHYYSNRGEPVSFVFASTAPQLTVTTAEPTDITAISAVSGGLVTSNGGSFVLMKGICWATHPYPIANDDYHTEDGSGTGSFTVSMTDLSPNTAYYVRAYAVSLNGLTYGEQYSFTTTASLPMVTTSQVTNITQTSAIGGGNVIDSGGATVTERGICWSTSHNPTTNSSHIAASSGGTGTYSVNMTSLSATTTYYVRAYATNSVGTSYGDEVSFVTPSAQNAIVNGGFETSGGYTSEYQRTYGSNVVEAGHYAIDNTTANHGGGGGWPEPSGSTGRFMIVNGLGGNSNPTTTVWTTQQPISVVNNTYYTFSCRVVNLNVIVQGQINPAKLQLKINGNPVGTVNQLPTNNDWQSWTVQWYSGNADQAVIQIVDMYTGNSFLGDDYAIDDISFVSDVISRNTINDDYNSASYHVPIEIDAPRSAGFANPALAEY